LIRRFRWRDILNLGVGEGSITEVSAQKSWGVEIHSSAQDLGELAFEAEELQARRATGLELHQHIHIARRPEIVAQN